MEETPMPMTALQRRIGRKGSDKEKIAASVIRAPGRIPELFEGLGSDKPAVRYGCSRVLRFVSEKEPRLLYPHMSHFIDQLNSENSFLKWDAIFIVAQLTRVDRRKKFEKIFDAYFAPVRGPVLVTAANILGAAPTIAHAKPKLTGRIVDEILKVRKARYKTTECRRVALGSAIDSLDRFFDQIESRKPVIDLVRAQLRSPRSSTKKKAQRFLKKHGLVS
jgi:hypothetical protein